MERLLKEAREKVEISRKNFSFLAAGRGSDISYQSEFAKKIDEYNEDYILTKSQDRDHDPFGFLYYHFHLGMGQKIEKEELKSLLSYLLCEQEPLREIVGVYGCGSDFYAQKVIHNFDEDLVRTFCPDYWG